MKRFGAVAGSQNAITQKYYNTPYREEYTPMNGVESQMISPNECRRLVYDKKLEFKDIHDSAYILKNKLLSKKKLQALEAQVSNLHGITKHGKGKDSDTLYFGLIQNYLGALDKDIQILEHCISTNTPADKLPTDFYRNGFQGSYSHENLRELEIMYPIDYEANALASYIPYESEIQSSQSMVYNDSDGITMDKYITRERLKSRAIATIIKLLITFGLAYYVFGIQSFFSSDGSGFFSGVPFAFLMITVIYNLCSLFQVTLNATGNFLLAIIGFFAAIIGGVLVLSKLASKFTGTFITEDAMGIAILVIMVLLFIWDIVGLFKLAKK